MANTMRAWTFTTRGPPTSVLTLRDDLPRPTQDKLGPDDVLVKVSHVAVFQGFATLMNIFPHFNANPWIPESSFSGMIEAVGSQVHQWKAGDAIFGSPNPKHYTKSTGKYNGMLAEYAIVPASQVVRKPENISFKAAAGLAPDGCTTLQFCEKAQLKRGDKVLVTAASGGLGSIVVQIVRTIVGSEGTIVGTCSAANADLVKSLGVDEVIDYRSHPQLHEYLAEHHSPRPFDVIIDVAGSDDRLYFESPRYLAPDGRFLLAGRMNVTHGGGSLLSILSFLITLQLRMHWPTFLGGVPRKLLFHSGEVVQDSMKKLPGLIENGQLLGLVDSEWEMEDAIKAYERVGTRRARGKVVVHVQEV